MASTVVLWSFDLKMTQGDAGGGLSCHTAPLQLVFFCIIRLRWPYIFVFLFHFFIFIHFLFSSPSSAFFLFFTFEHSLNIASLRVRKKATNLPQPLRLKLGHVSAMDPSAVAPQRAWGRTFGCGGRAGGRPEAVGLRRTGPAEVRRQRHARRGEGSRQQACLGAFYALLCTLHDMPRTAMPR